MFKKNDTLRNVLLAGLAYVALLFAGCNQAVDDGNSDYVKLNDGNPVSVAYAIDSITTAKGGTIEALISNVGLDNTANGKALLVALADAIRGNPSVSVKLDFSNVWFDDDGTTTDVFGAEVEFVAGGDEGAREVTTAGKFGKTTTTADFSGIKNLVGIVLPFTIEEIEENAFTGCENLETVTINFFFTEDVNKNGKYTGEYMFDDVYLLKKIGAYAFDGCKNLRTFIITSDPDNDEYEDEAFPISLADIGNYAFRNCYSLEKIRFLTSRNSYNDAVHGDVDGAVDETAKRKAGSINSSFIDADGISRNRVNGNTVAGLTDPIDPTDLPATTALVLKLGTGAFQNCTSVETLDLTNKVALTALAANTVAESAFDGCTSLRTILLNTFAAGFTATDLANIDDPATDKAKPGVGFWGYEVGSANPGRGSLADAIVSTFAPVKIYGDKSFQFTALSGDTVTDLFHVEDYSENGSVDADKKDVVTQIGDRAFFGCSELGETVELPHLIGGVAAKGADGYLGDGAFANTNVKYIYLHNNFQNHRAADGTKDGDAAVNPGLFSVTQEEFTADPTLRYWLGALIDDKPAQLTEPVTIFAWYVLNEDIDGNLGYLPSSQNPNTKVLGEALTTIKGDAFYNNVDLKRIVLPSGITGTAPAILGSYAFANCENLEFAAYDGDLSDWADVYDNVTKARGAFSNVALTEVLLSDGTKAVVNNR